MFRKIIFWLHLVIGAIAGLVIGMMCVTGVILAFEKEIVAWSEREVRQVEPAAAETRLSLDELQARFGEVYPDLAPDSVTVSDDPEAAVVFAIGRARRIYADPYRGEFAEPEAGAVAGFMRTMVEWHRWLALSGDNRAFGRAITGASNLAFVILGVSGLYLWWPRRLRWQHLRQVLWFRKGLSGKARDWNWHNVFGFWSLPGILVLAGTAVVISYPWASDLVYRTVGEEPPPRRQGPPRAAPPPAVDRPAAGAALLPLEQLAATVRESYPDWREIRVRLPKENSAESASAIAIDVQTREQWPLFSRDNIVLDPYSGAVLSAQSFADSSRGRQARSWMRFLHTGEAFGWFGKLVAGVISAAGAVLVWTGFSLAWQRFRQWRSRSGRRKPEARAAAGETDRSREMVSF